MHERELRNVLWIQAVEQTDAAGEVLALTERVDATRATLRAEPALAASAERSAAPGEVDRLLASRAQRLRPQLDRRWPQLGRMVEAAGATGWLARLGLAGAFALGLGLSGLEGSRRVDILAFPFLGLIVWNLGVYLLLILAAMRGHTATSRTPLHRRWLDWRGEAGLRRVSSSLDAPLGAALNVFAAAWLRRAGPLLRLRAERTLHAGAALLALGLIAGLYLRGIALRYEAGWESTFLGPTAVATLLRLLYGPASALTAIALPSSGEQLQRLQWHGSTGADAAPFIHLMAVTCALYVVLPRAALWLSASLALQRRARRMRPAPELVLYARTLLRQAGQRLETRATVLAYAYAPGPEAIAGLGALLGESLGAGVELDVRAPIEYGDEDAFLAQFNAQLDQAPSPGANWLVVLMSLASTPEAETHGLLLVSLRELLERDGEHAGLLVVIDEASYAARMHGDAGFEQRLQVRRELWRGFVAERALSVCCVDLSRAAAGLQAEPEARAALRAALCHAEREVLAP